TSGVVSAASNRRAIRIAQEPFDMFRAYFAVYAREQAYCHFSPALIANLERYWNAQTRKPRCNSKDELTKAPAKFVIAELDAAIHPFRKKFLRRRWMRGASVRA